LRPVVCWSPSSAWRRRDTYEVDHAAQQAALRELRPIRRRGTPDDVALAAFYLASDDASWVTGIIFNVAGGAVMV